MNHKIRSTFVLGSTSAIANSICIELAIRGCNKFHLVSRNLEKNQDLISILEKKYLAKVTHEKHNLFYEYNLEKPFVPSIGYFDLYIITAGWMGKENAKNIDSVDALKITASNYLGIIPWINEIIQGDRIQKPGIMWVFSSVAGDRGRPSNYKYGAAKSALTTYCEGLHLSYKDYPFKIRVIKAGFIDTLMTKGRAPKFLCLSPNRVAKILLKNPNKRGVEYLPWWWEIIMFIIKRLPSEFASKL